MDAKHVGGMVTGTYAEVERGRQVSRLCRHLGQCVAHELLDETRRAVPLLVEASNHGKLRHPVHFGSVHKVHLHVVVATSNLVLRGRVGVELLQSVSAHACTHAAINVCRCLTLPPPITRLP